MIVVPLVAALVMNHKFPGRNMFRAVYFAPYVLGVAVVGVLWRYLLDANIGAVNAYLGKLGLPSDQSAMPRFTSEDSSSSRKRLDHKLSPHCLIPPQPRLPVVIRRHSGFLICGRP